MRRALATLLAATVVAGCGGGGGTATTDTAAEMLEARALDFAFSAQRALEGTRFGSLGDDWLAGLVLEVCGILPHAANPAGPVAAVLDDIDAPPGALEDDTILAEVLGAGLAEVCPDAVFATGTTGAADAEGAFVAAALPEIEAAGLGSRIGPVEIIDAGSALCAVLDAGGTPEEAVLAEIMVLFGVAGESVVALSESGALDDSEARAAGAILATAAAFLCPGHRPAMQEYLADLEG